MTMAKLLDVNIKTDPGQNNNVADQNPDLLKQMIADYNNFAEEVGVVIPTGEKAACTIFKDLSNSKPNPDRQYRRDYTTI